MRNVLAGVICAVMLSLVGCGSEDTGSEKDSNVITILDKAPDVTDPSITNRNGSFTVPQLKINGMDCIVIEFSTDDVRNGISFSCDWDSKPSA